MFNINILTIMIFAYSKKNVILNHIMFLNDTFNHEDTQKRYLLCGPLGNYCKAK